MTSSVVALNMTKVVQCNCTGSPMYAHIPREMTSSSTILVDLSSHVWAMACSSRETVHTVPVEINAP